MNKMMLIKVVIIMIFSLVFSNCNNDLNKLKSNINIKSNHENCIIIDSIIQKHGDKSTLSSKELALKVGELYLKATYGNSKINEQMPLKIETYQDSLWKISGTYQRKNSTKFYIGGCAEIILSKVDGKVISITHYV